MEVIYGGELFKSKSSVVAPSRIPKCQCRNLSANELGQKMDVGKKRGVYVETRVNAKHGDDKKSNPTSRPRTRRLLTSAPEKSKISTYTHLLGTVDPVVRFIKRKPKKTLPSEKLSKQSSKTSRSKSSKHDMPGNVVENKKLKINKSNAHKIQRKKSVTDNEIIQGPSKSSGITRQKSYEATWSAIFPKKESSSDNTHLLKQYVCNYEQTVVKTNTELDDKIANFAGKEKVEPIYNFFIDLLESVYDDDNTKNPDTRGETSDIHLEIDDHVAQKLESQEESSNHYTIKDDNLAYDQSRQLADYYNKSRLEPVRKKKNKCVHMNKAESKGKAKKPNLLNLLKQQLSFDINMYEEPESMYDALLNIAKNKRKRKQIYFEVPEKPKKLEVCRFKRRQVISPSTRMPKQSRPTKNSNLNSINLTGGKRTRSVTSTKLDSSHSLEVLGFDYDETDFVELHADDSEVEMAITDITVNVRPITSLNQGITTVTHNWKH